MPVYFHEEDIRFRISNKQILKSWIKNVIESQKKRLGSINIIFTSNNYILTLNREYLNHNYFTDVISFNYNDGSDISGDIFVSIDQVKINSNDLKVEFKEELHRVIIHGILHLIGYGDSSMSEKKEMRKMENYCLKLMKTTY